MTHLCLALLLWLTVSPGHPPLQYWDLPTGSHIAIVHFGAGHSPTPVIYLHGGPGADFVSAVREHPNWWQGLGARGADIYIYDQIGSGLSARLSDPTRYTVRRHVDDLDAIRHRIGAQQIVLIGESWGATLAANYMAVHPGVVARVVFVSPGQIERAGAIPELGIPVDIMNFLRATRPGAISRYEEVDRRLKNDVRAAYALASDGEMDQVLNDFVNTVIRRQTVHDPAQAGKLFMRGMGWWSYLMTNWDLSAHSNRPGIKLAGNRTPALVVRGQSDYIEPRYAEEYMRVFPAARMVRIANAGHIIWLEQPKALAETLETVIFALRNERAPPAVKQSGAHPL
jgi:proline iminopeptidase